jgi:hypothetical protein
MGNTPGGAREFGKKPLRPIQICVLTDISKNNVFLRFQALAELRFKK